MEEEMYRLENYMYLTSRKGVLGWVRNAEQGVELIAQKHPNMTDQEKGVADYVFRICYKYFNNPDTSVEGRQSVIESRRGYGFEPYTDGRNSIAYFSPMMFKGFSSRLATIIVQGEEVYVVRCSKEQAMPLDAYIALLQSDARSLMEKGRFDLLREGCSYPVSDAPYPTELVLHNGDWSAPIADISAEDIENLGIILDDNARTMLDMARDIRQSVPSGIITANKENVWRHIRTGSTWIGRYPNSFGYHERVFDKIGMIYPNLISNRAGVVMQFILNGNSFIITCNFRESK